MKIFPYVGSQLNTLKFFSPVWIRRDPRDFTTDFAARENMVKCIEVT